MQPSLALSASVAGVCVGEQVTLAASGASGNNPQYTWYQDGALQPETGATLTRANLTATTTFSVTANTATCGTSTQQLVVPVNGLSVSNAAPTICSGSSTSFTANYSGSGATFRWYSNTSGQLLQTNTNVTSSTYTTPTLTTSTAYRVEATTNDCSSVPLTQVVQANVGALTAAVLPGTSLSVCPSSAVTLTASSNNPNATYQWFTLNVANNGSVTEVIIPGATSAQYSYFTGSQGNVTDRFRVRVSAASCTAQNVDVTVGRATAINTIRASASSVCAGTPVALTAGSNISDATYAWYINGNRGAVLSTLAQFSPSPTATTQYNVDVTTGCGVQTLSTTVATTPAVSVTPEAATVFLGNAVTITASGGTTSTYVWTATNDNVTTTLAETGATINPIPAAGTTVYRATGTLANGCTNTDVATITARPAGQVLPVELTDFSAAWTGKFPVLTWVTASEKNNAYFAVERSFDGVSFTTVGERAGAGTTTTRTTYEFVDAALSKGVVSTVYYRLRQVDKDEKEHRSMVLTVRTPGVARSLNAALFPNPFEDEVWVRFDSVTPGQATIVVNNIVGQLVLRQTVLTGVGLQEVKLDAPQGLRAGVYQLSVEQGLQKQVLKMVRK
ncbi:Ig-like domain-containing protein [Hymenobacter sublimis]|uniref:T9SS type A sorting domain-containing protein n=1 Tax=Hymenobacter sublimis TaxID=2933777 RepID=A0ABY4J723_9BACT|nr:T9SS type A sorting domain-containing protein [Hymenobacter sublimis]UPL48226.1 T9SS type A sorting domain-containing protein [Hymenobacter sublimis]